MTLARVLNWAFSVVAMMVSVVVTIWLVGQPNLNGGGKAVAILLSGAQLISVGHAVGDWDHYDLGFEPKRLPPSSFLGAASLLIIIGMALFL